MQPHSQRLPLARIRHHQCCCGFQLLGPQTSCCTAASPLHPHPHPQNTHTHFLLSLSLSLSDDALPKFFKTANGVRVQELIVGNGPQAQQGDAVLIDYVLRRANGYFIYGECEAHTHT